MLTKVLKHQALKALASNGAQQLATQSLVSTQSRLFSEEKGPKFEDLLDAKKKERYLYQNNPYLLQHIN